MATPVVKAAAPLIVVVSGGGGGGFGSGESPLLQENKATSTAIKIKPLYTLVCRIQKRCYDYRGIRFT